MFLFIFSGALLLRPDLVFIELLQKLKGFKLYISKFIIALVAMQILNLSIDIQNFQPQEPKNSLCYFNEMNSVVELVTEKMITKRDTFPERNDHNNDGAQTHKHANIETFFPVQRFADEIEETTYLIHNTFLPVTVGLIYSEIQSPPPKSC